MHFDDNFVDPADQMVALRTPESMNLQIDGVSVETAGRHHSTFWFLVDDGSDSVTSSTPYNGDFETISSSGNYVRRAEMDALGYELYEVSGNQIRVAVRLDLLSTREIADLSRLNVRQVSVVHVVLDGLSSTQLAELTRCNSFAT